MKPVSFKELKMAIKSLKNAKYTGLDNIPAEVFKNMSDKNLRVLQEFFSNIIETQDIPSQWKEDKMILIFKGKGDKMKLDNYRGISIGNVIGKIF